MNKQTRDRLRELSGKAAKAPWLRYPHGEAPNLDINLAAVIESDNPPITVCELINEDESKNAELICEMRNSIDELLAYVDLLEARDADLEAHAKKFVKELMCEPCKRHYLNKVLKAAWKEDETRRGESEHLRSTPE